MTDDKPKHGPGGRSPAAAGGPPKLERVAPPGAPPRLDRVPPGASAAKSPPRPPAERATPPSAAPKASYGLAAREVGADAAIAAGIAHEGALAADGPLRLFALAAAVQATGRLGIDADAEARSTGSGQACALWFRRGTVEHATSSDPADELGAFLVRKGAITEAQRGRAQAASAAAGGDLSAALIGERLVNPADVAALLQEHRAGIVQRALHAVAGRWSWDPAAPPPPGAFPLGAPFAMLCAAMRSLDSAALVARLGDREHRVASRVGGRIRLEDLRLTAQEARGAGLFDGQRSPGELALANPADAVVLLRMALLLAEVELLSFGASRKGAAPPAARPPPAERGASAPPERSRGAAPAEPRGAPRPAGSAAPAGVKPVAAAKAPEAPALTPTPELPTPRPARRAVALDVAAVGALVKKLASADHFAALGVARTAPPAQIKAAYFQLAKTYHPDAVPADAPPDLRKLCAEVFSRLSEAWAVLGEDASRAAYVEELESGGAQSVDVMNIFAAERLFEEGALLAKARRYGEAIAKFEQATKANPEEAEFGMWKAFCEFLLADDKRAKLASSAAAIEAGLKKNPRCAQGYLFLGQMAKVAGDAALAERQLRRGLAVAPEHADLQRELKYLRK
ncbi:MAG TPA: DnaJ domain-containing protein [Anaeromyxobacter sp.]|nr:DnaJ domain-containing protein [Anaeromyxobacter sp.]